MSHYTQSTKRRRRLSPREYHLCPGCTYMVTNTDHPIIHKRQSVTDIRQGHPHRTTVSDNYSGQLLWTTTPDNYSGQLLRTTTPDNYSGGRRRTQGFSAPSPRTSLASGKLPTRLPVSPAPVMPTSKVAGLGRDSLMHDGGASSLCWSVA